MSRKDVHRQRLIEVSGLTGVLAERMMTAYAVGGQPPEPEVQAFCRAVLLLEEHGAALPRHAEAVIARLQAQVQAHDEGRGTGLRTQQIPPAVAAPARPAPASGTPGAAVRSWRLRLSEPALRIAASVRHLRRRIGLPDPASRGTPSWAGTGK